MVGGASVWAYIPPGLSSPLVGGCRVWVELDGFITITDSSIGLRHSHIATGRQTTAYIIPHVKVLDWSRTIG